MRATGIVRRIDDLGRVVIPKEIRKTLNIRDGDPLEIFIDPNEKSVCFSRGVCSKMPQKPCVRTTTFASSPLMSPLLRARLRNLRRADKYPRFSGGMARAQKFSKKGIDKHFFLCYTIITKRKGDTKNA